MDWSAKVELFEQIRREYEFGIGTVVGVARKLGVHRRMVREAIGSALPKPRKKRLRGALRSAVRIASINSIASFSFHRGRSDEHRVIAGQLSSSATGNRVGVGR